METVESLSCTPTNPVGSGLAFVSSLEEVKDLTPLQTMPLFFLPILKDRYTTYLIERGGGNVTVASEREKKILIYMYISHTLQRGREYINLPSSPPQKKVRYIEHFTE